MWERALVRAGAEMEGGVSERETEAEARALPYNFVQKRLPRLTKTSFLNCLPGHGTASPFPCAVTVCDLSIFMLDLLFKVNILKKVVPLGGDQIMRTPIVNEIKDLTKDPFFFFLLLYPAASPCEDTAKSALLKHAAGLTRHQT